MQMKPPVPRRNMVRISERRQEEVARLLDSTERLLGMRCIFHDIFGLSGLPNDRRVHNTPPCRDVRIDGDATCVQFDYHSMHRRMPGMPQGERYDCPFGYAKIAVPVFVLGQYAGVLFAGPCWRRKEKPPHPDLPIIRDEERLDDAWRMLQAVALRLGFLLEGEPHYILTGRRDEIRRFLRDHLDAEITIHDLAEALSLSPSRTAHLVQETFGAGFTALVRNLRMRQAAEWLMTTDRPVSEIARLCGIADQNYFTRLFRKEFACSPREYRNGPYCTP